jgi:hypothetical protein
MAREAWVVFKTVNPTWGSLGLGTEVHELLGVPKATGKPLTPEERMLAFLDRGPGVVRVINIYASARLYGESLTQHKIVAQALPGQTFIFNLPDKVEKHLGMQTEWVAQNNNTRTLDTLAWIIPENEYYAYRQAIREGQAYELPRGGPAHLYLRKANFTGVLRPLRELEGPTLEIQEVVAQVPRAKKAEVAR